MSRRSNNSPRVYWSKRWSRWYVALPSGYVCAHGAAWRDALRLAGVVVGLLPRQWETVESLGLQFWFGPDGEVEVGQAGLFRCGGDTSWECSSAKV